MLSPLLSQQPDLERAELPAPRRRTLMRAWLNALRHPRQRPARRPARKILMVEELESRVMPVAGDILVTNNQLLQLYTPTGTLQSSKTIPPGGDAFARDLIVDYVDN